MLIKKLMLLFYSAMLPLCSLSQDTDTAFKLRIKGAKIPKTAKVYLLYQRDGKKIVDSAQSTNRTFIFTGMLKEPVHAFILCDTMQLGFSEILKRKNEKQDSQQLFIYPGQIVLKTSTSSIADLRPVGGLNATYFRLQDRLQTLTQQQIELSRILVQATDRTSIPALKTKWDSLKRVEKHILRVFIIENPNSFIALHALQSYAGALPQVSEIELLFNKISPSVRQTPTGKEFRKFLSDQHDLNPGTKAPEFVQNDTTGKPISLASFKGKYLLIDF
ncbi:DUF4369 domain-containing protein [Sphingobacterium sp. MYb382]|uniref:DUF4369 domain-containing protein n=1 Tax=Sphingobacterium sp. MYb382 TaxID=2745278 RepID=UPI0030B40174